MKPDAEEDHLKFCVTVILPVSNAYESNEKSYFSNEDVIDLAMELSCPIFSQKFLIDHLEGEVNECPAFYPADPFKKVIDDGSFLQSFIEKKIENDWKRIHVIGPDKQVSIFMELIEGLPIFAGVKASAEAVELC